ncbi:MAG: methylated-DNA--[protein]-cysteine S-methyltransferase [Sulfuricaulis sp.]
MRWLPEQYMPVALMALSVDNKCMQNGRASSRIRDYDAVIATPVGRLGVVLVDAALTDLSFLSDSAALYPPRTASAKRVCRQLRSYFINPRLSFHLELKPLGTEFQKRVWRALQRIAAGETRSYGALARKLATSARAVGNACRANPIPLIIPCHRVVASDGTGGFMGKRSGFALRLKRRLLRHELVG